MALSISLNVFGTALNVTAAVAPVPGVAAVAIMITKIIEICQNVTTNKQVVLYSPLQVLFINTGFSRLAVYQLKGRCETLLKCLGDDTAAKIPDLKDVINDSERYLVHVRSHTSAHTEFISVVSVLADIEKRLGKWSQWGFLRSFCSQDMIKRDLEEFNRTIDGLCERFNVLIPHIIPKKG